MSNVSEHMQFEKTKQEMLNITMHKHVPSIITQKLFIQRARGKTGVAEVRTLRKYNIISVKNMHWDYHMHTKEVYQNMQSNSHNNILTDFFLS